MKQNRRILKVPKFIRGFFLCLFLGSTIVVAAKPDVGYLAQQNRNNPPSDKSFKVSGKVTDENGEPIIGVNVVFKGKSKVGVITNTDGYYEITIPDDNGILLFSYIGYSKEEVQVNGQRYINVKLSENLSSLDEVTVVGYGSQKKVTLTGAISSIKTAELLKSPNASISNMLAGKITGISSIQSSGQPGKDDAAIYLRGVGTLSEAGSKPLILVDGVERSFFQMDPNEIESVTVLKDASATAVFGVRGANGVIMVTTRRGEEGTAKISVSSSFSMQEPTRMLKTINSYDWATLYNERDRNDGIAESELKFSPYALERFRLKDQPILYPSVDWREYLMKKMSLQTQHNINISGGSKEARYFISMGYLHQGGIFREFDELDYNTNYNYDRYNYRANLDLNLTKSTLLKLNMGGVLGRTKEPNKNLFELLPGTSPLVSPGVIDGKKVMTNSVRFPMYVDANVFANYYGGTFNNETSNTLNLDLHLIQNLDIVTKGLSAEIKGAYNADYSYGKSVGIPLETYIPYYYSELKDKHLKIGDPGYNTDVVYQILGSKSAKTYGSMGTSRGRNWYMEGSLRYARKFGEHDISFLALYNQSKRYYPSQFTEVPTAYLGFVGRATYSYKSRYLAEFNFGYNGSENFAPGKRFGKFPAGSIGYIISEEPFMKNNKIIDFLKIRGTVGLVGNDNVSGYRFMYLPNGYDINVSGLNSFGYADLLGGYVFGTTNTTWDKGATEKTIGNPNITWEKALKMNVGLDVNLLKNKLKITADIFKEKRKDILIVRQTVPQFTSLTTSLPVVNLGRVDNYGYEFDINWNDKIGKLGYSAQLNLSYANNKIIFQDEVEPPVPYQWRTGNPVGSVFGYVTERFYEKNDFNDDGTLKSGLPIPTGIKIKPGDSKYQDLNNDNIIDVKDQKLIGRSKRPLYIVGFNYGIEYKGFFTSMNWTAGLKGNVIMSYTFNNPFRSPAVYQYLFDGRWTEETASTAIYPRVSTANANYNNVNNTTTWVKDNSYLKLKTMTFGYNVTNKKILNSIGASLLSIKISGYNLLTFDNIMFMDPEGNPNNADTYPIMKILSLGLNVTF